MPDYRRYYVPGGTYFFTVVTHERTPILTEPLARRCLREALQLVLGLWPFEIVAMVLLPDHLHAIWTLPSGDDKYSIRWSRIKEHFTRAYLDLDGQERDQSESRARQRRRGVWQKRFWEHTCQDETDLERCFDYIHWNPRKHRLVSAVKDWPWSTFHKHVRLGHYPEDWGGIDPCIGLSMPESVGPDA